MENTEYIYIRNFGPIKKLELSLKQFNVFIGPQGTGKSTVAKLISIFRDIKFLLNDADHKSFFNRYNISAYFINTSNKDTSTYLEYSCVNYSIKYENKKFDINRGKLFEPVMSKEESLYNMIRSSLLKDFNKNSKLNRNNINEEIVDDLLQSLIEKGDYFSPILNSLIKNSIYVPSERMLISLLSSVVYSVISSSIPLPKNIIEFGKLFESARSSISDFNIDFLNIRYYFHDSKDKIYYSSKKFITLQESASGYQSIVPMLLVIENLCRTIKRQRTFIVEEPELSLYPLTQKNLIEYISQKCNEINSDLIITTHSPYVLSSFQNLLFADKIVDEIPDSIKEVTKIVNQNMFVKGSNFTCYFFDNGEAQDIYNPKTKLINDNRLDDVSEEIASDFDALMDIYKSR